MATRKAELDFINYLNILLILASCGLAFYLPFELLLVSYAFLGPLHYLTEISWLHDKNYFVEGRYDPIALILPAIPLTLAVSSHYVAVGNWVAIVVGVTFGASAAMVLCKSLRGKLLFTAGTLLAVLLAITSGKISIFIALFLPSLVHVYFFTGAFMLFGSLKSRSVSGHVSFLIFLLCPILFFLFQPNFESQQLSAYVQSNIPPFMQLKEELSGLLGLAESWDTTVAVMRFLAFAYLYHYLNWFSKTKIIRWHEVSVQRTAFLSVIYLACISLYIFDYALGFIAAYFLSLIHVFLEFPLNHRSFIGIGQEIRSRIAPQTV